MPLTTSTWSRTSTEYAPASSRFSRWFHGHSVIESKQSQISGHSPKIWQARGRSESPDPRTGLGHWSTTRSPSSTRSIIDPTSSPNIGTEPALPSPSSHAARSLITPIAGTRYEEEAVIGVPGRRRVRTRLALSRPRKTKTSKTSRPLCFPSIRDPKLRHKAIGTLLSGTLLCVVLTTYLTLAISTTASGPAFHALLLTLIILLTILFAHYLLRLLMLSLRPHPKNRTHRTSELLSQSQAGRVARPREPIRIILAQDEELGSGEMAEEDKDIAIPPPPPAYGAWRCSVRADPELVYWQRTGEGAIADGERSESVPPPSYRERERGVEELERVVVREERGPWESYAEGMGV